MSRPLLASDLRIRGFTLLEMLVVLVLAAITVSVVGAGGQAYMERSRYNQTVRDVSSQLNKARALSVQEGRSVTVTYQSDIRRLVVQWEAIERNSRTGKTATAVGEPIFVFNSDCGARGGRLAVLRGGQGVSFRVNWLLGTVEQSMVAAQS